MMKLLVGGQHCPLADGTVHCPKNYSDHLSIHVNIIEYNCEYNVTVVLYRVYIVQGKNFVTFMLRENLQN